MRPAGGAPIGPAAGPGEGGEGPRPRPWAAAAVALGLLLPLVGLREAPAEAAAREGASTADRQKAPPADRDRELHLYVPNQMGASISILDGTGTLLETVDLRALGFSGNAMPHQVAAAPDGSAWYATLAGDGRVVRFDGANRLVARARFEAPGMVVLDPRRDRLYVTRALSAVSPPSSLGVFRASDLTLLEEAEIFIPRPHGLAVDTASGRVFAASLSEGRIAVREPDRGRVSLIDAEDAPNGFVGLAASPDGRLLVATTQITNRLLAFDATGEEVPSLLASVAVEPGPYDVAFHPDGRSVWFPNQSVDAVTRVDVATWSVAATIRHEAFVEPHGVVFAPDGRAAYVTSHGRALGSPGGTPARPTGTAPPAGSRANGTVAVIDGTTGAVRAVTEVGPYAAAPGLAGARRAVEPTGVPERFDGPEVESR